MTSRDYYYTIDTGDKVYLTDCQAEEVYRQRERYYKACDLKTLIEDEFSDDKYLASLEVDDLMNYADILLDELCKMDMDQYWEIVRNVIEEGIMIDKEE